MHTKTHATKDTIEQIEKPLGFASKLNFYQCFWLFFIGSFLGVIIEMFWCLARNGYVESRTGLIYGLFNPVYGFGALALTLGLYWLKDKSDIYIFIGGMFIGSIVEFVSSWVQETFLGSISWDYSNLPFNLGGRVSLMYSIFWGILAIVWIKTFYPMMKKWIDKIPNKYGKPLTWILLLFMICNMAFSSLAVARWNDRLNHPQKQTTTIAVDKYLDEKFNDDKMLKYYPNMDHTAAGRNQ